MPYRIIAVALCALPTSFWIYNGTKTYGDLVDKLTGNNFIKGRGFTVKDLDYQPYDTYLLDSEIAEMLLATQHQMKPDEDDTWYFGNRYKNLTMGDFWERPEPAKIMAAGEDSQNEINELAA